MSGFYHLRPFGPPLNPMGCENTTTTWLKLSQLIGEDRNRTCDLRYVLPVLYY
jgi:hypothetical protein